MRNGMGNYRYFKFKKFHFLQQSIVRYYQKMLREYLLGHRKIRR